MKYVKKYLQRMKERVCIFKHPENFLQTGEKCLTADTQCTLGCHVLNPFSLPSVINAARVLGGKGGKNKSDTWINNVSGEKGLLLCEENWLLWDGTHQAGGAQTQIETESKETPIFNFHSDLRSGNINKRYLLWQWRLTLQGDIFQ